MVLRALSGDPLRNFFGVRVDFGPLANEAFALGVARHHSEIALSMPTLAARTLSMRLLCLPYARKSCSLNMPISDFASITEKRSDETQISRDEHSQGV